MADSSRAPLEQPQHVSAEAGTLSSTSGAANTQAASNAPSGSAIEFDPATDTVEHDTDSAFGDDNASSTQSLRSSVWTYTYENGRRYHTYGQTPYFSPNDEPENDRLDICNHMFSLLLKGELHLASLPSDPQRILDLGTGTGMWAIDIADKYPSAYVIGNDISPVQTNLVPPNLQFEVDDIEQDWAYSSPFDYIHGRYLNGAVRDWPRLMRQAYANTKSGGWVEFMDFTMTFYTNSGDFRPGCAVDEWTKNLKKWLYDVGVEPEPGPKLEGWIRDAGFQNVSVRRVPCPVGMWPKDKRLKEAGTFNLIQFLENLEGFSLRALTAQGWQREEIQVHLAQVRNDFKDPKFRMQHDGFVVWAQKP